MAKGPKNSRMPPPKNAAERAARQVKAVAAVVAECVRLHELGKPVDVYKIRAAECSKLSLDGQPKLVDLLAAVPQKHKKALTPLLLSKPVRTASGIAVVAVMCKPHRCPHIAMTGHICVYWYVETPSLRSSCDSRSSAARR